MTDIATIAILLLFAILIPVWVRDVREASEGEVEL